MTLREYERDDELPLLVGEVGEVDDRATRLAFRRAQERGRVERLAGAPGRECRRSDEAVQLQRELCALLGREERVHLEDAELADRRRLDLAEQGAEVEALARAPRMLDQVGEQHVLAARERVGLDPDQAEQAGHRPLDLVAERLRLALPRERGRVQRADDVQGHAGLRAGGVDGELGRFAKRPDPVGADALSLEAFAPGRRRLGREFVEREALAARVVLVHPGAEAGRVELREGQQQVAHVALRVEHEAWNPRQQDLFDQIDG